jgi:hypothetical protein
VETAMNPIRAFTDHPASVGESYWQHMAFAVRFGARMIGGGLACLVHALLPFAFVTRGSETVRALHGMLARQRPEAVGAPAPSRDPGVV